MNFLLLQLLLDCQTVNMVELTNVVVQADLSCSINLRCLANSTRDIKYDPHKFIGAVWHHRSIGGNCLVFHNGKVNCNGNKTIHQAKKRLRQYARLLQRHGFAVNLKKIIVVTISAVHRLSSRLNLKDLCEMLRATYNPELLNAAILKKKRINFNCFQSGAVVITGIRRMRDLDKVIYPTLLELELCTS